MVVKREQHSAKLWKFTDLFSTSSSRVFAFRSSSRGLFGINTHPLTPPGQKNGCGHGPRIGAGAEERVPVATAPWPGFLSEGFIYMRSS